MSKLFKMAMQVRDAMRAQEERREIKRRARDATRAPKNLPAQLGPESVTASQVASADSMYSVLDLKKNPYPDTN